MTLPQNIQRLRAAWTDLTRQWSRTREAWLDSIGGEFERDFWQEIQRVTPEFISELESVEQVIRQARSRVH